MPPAIKNIELLLNRCDSNEQVRKARPNINKRYISGIVLNKTVQSEALKGFIPPSE